MSYAITGWAMAAGIAYAFSSSSTSKKTAASASQQKQRIEADARKKSLGNLTEGEAKASASKKMFREGLYFTSPTGLGTSEGTRGRSRLMGA